MDENNSERDFSAVSQATAAKEAEAYELFSQRYDREFPKPPAPSVTMMKTIGWQFVSIVVQSVFAITLAALRTADMFYAAAAGTNTTVQFVEAVAAIGAIELGIVIFATIKSEIENSKTELVDLKSALKIDLRLLWTGIIACVAISIIAGLGVSFKGFGLNLEWMNWVVAIVMGIGASLVAWVSGDILGAMLARWSNASALASLEYNEAQETRETKKRGMWEAAPERQIARSELVELKEFIASQRAANRPVRAPAPRSVPQPRKTSTRSNEVRLVIFDYLDRTYAAEKRIAGATEVMKEKGVAKSYAWNVIKAWTEEHPELEFPTSETEADNDTQA